LIRLSLGAVFLHAAILSAESIVIELLATRLQFPPLAISATSIPLAVARGALGVLGIYIIHRRGPQAPAAASDIA
jgi:hypothetical protein